MPIMNFILLILITNFFRLYMVGLEVWCLTQLSTIFQLYHGENHRHVASH